MALKQLNTPSLSSSRLKLRIEDAFNLDTRSKHGITSKICHSTPYFTASAAITDGRNGDIPWHSPSSSSSSLSHRHNRCDTWASTEAVKSTDESTKNRDGQNDATCLFYSDLFLEYVHDSESVIDGRSVMDLHVEIVLHRIFGTKTRSEEVGSVVMTVQEILELTEQKKEKGCRENNITEAGKKKVAELMLFDEGGDVVTSHSNYLPTIVRVSIDKGSLPDEAHVKTNEGGSNVSSFLAPNPHHPRTKYAKHIMMITRGTRGDVQPFIALARGLAELYDWKVTIVTENAYRTNIKSHSRVNAGSIQFRPSGGDTMRRVQSKLCQRAINMKVCSKQTDFMQKIFLGRSEFEFYPSEPAVFYWAQRLRPDILLFGFTMASVTIIASEKLGIPLVGFVLQPTCIPSAAYPPVLPLKEECFREISENGVLLKEHNRLKILRHVMQTKAPGGLDVLRSRRGLEEYDVITKEGLHLSTWQDLLDNNVPLIVPINEKMFGGKPKDWSENAVFTDCIYLRGETVPQLAPDASEFLKRCRDVGGKVVVLAFSSMPVSKPQIANIALRLIRECTNKVCVFALVGKNEMKNALDANLERKTKAAVDSNRLFLTTGAPFGRLFPLVDTVVLHGGLGTTSEVLMAGNPAIVTGVLLLDQRFWGCRCAEMGVGPFGTHIDDFPDVCVEYIDKALSNGSAWKENAVKLGKDMTELAGTDPSGVQRNADCVARMSKIALPYSYKKAEQEDGPEGEGVDDDDASCSTSSSMSSSGRRVRKRIGTWKHGLEEIYFQIV